MDKIQTIHVSAPSNIALIKYWGKKEGQLPLNPSLSLTLSKCLTKMDVSAENGHGFALSFYFEKEIKVLFQNKIEKKLKSLQTVFPWISETKFIISTSNTFPHSSGIASSASSMAALSKALVFFDKKYNRKDVIEARYKDEEDEFQFTSSVARELSGSAARSFSSSVYYWGQNKIFKDSSDLHAMPLQKNLNFLKEMQDVICIVSKDVKAVSSTDGHALMNNHPYRNARIDVAHQRFGDLIDAIFKNDFYLFADLVEREALDLHALMMTSTPSFILLEPQSLAVIKLLREYRQTHAVKLTFTIDAGPNIHLLYPKSEIEKVVPFLALIKSRNLALDFIFDEVVG